MNKDSKRNFYQTEYSLSFQWNKNEKQTNKKYFNTKYQSTKSSRSYPRNNELIYRHRLKQILLKRLEKMEEELNNERRHKLSPNNSIKSERRKLNSTERRTSKVETKYNKNEDFCSELRRSRSMALEFKQKNESTQLWWWNEELELEYSDTESYTLFERRSPTSSIPKDNFSYKTPYRAHSFIITKPCINDNSPSTTTKSSISAQIAQATGYQSTTDDFSSFNHDNDAKSIDQNESNLQTYSHNNQFSRSLNIPALKLDLKKERKKSKDHLTFQEPYQKEDFVADTPSSDSNVDVLNSATYRLE